MTFRTSLVAATGLAVFLVAAGGAAAEVPKGISSAKLALMPLPLAAYGPEAARLTLDTDQSGSVDNADAAEGSTDRTDSAAALKAAGRITGYDVTFADYSQFARPGNLVLVSSGAELDASARQASAGVARYVRDITTADPANGFVLLDIARFAAPRLGEDAQGFRIAARIGRASCRERV